MVSVTARKIRELARAAVPGERTGLVISATQSRAYTGFLISYPVVGRGMIIFRDPHGHRMITTPVRRILGEPSGRSIWVETENSVYRLTFHGAPLVPMTTPPAGEATA